MVGLAMTPKTKLLFVDDDDDIRLLFSEAMIDEALLIKTASDGEKALKELKNFPADIVITDIKMPNMDGFALLHEIKMHHPDIFVLMLTGHGSVEDAVKAMKAGAYDYILKPLDFRVIRTLLKKITAHHRILENTVFSGKGRRKEERFENIIGHDSSMFEVFRKIADVAGTSATVLITGETGTGKELIAEAIHYRSPRRNKPLVKVNCASLPETLIASELFGHEKGAFTGAIAQKKGYFELADESSIFLDEIGDIPIPTQISFLRVLESGTFQRVGNPNTLEVDTRVICATNKDLHEAVREKIFREDLFYRINVVPISIPPLRERKSDIQLLANYFLRKNCLKTGKRVLGISRAALEVLTRYHWPGNVRELRNAIEHASIFCKGREITPNDINRDVRHSIETEQFSFTLSSSSLPAAESTLISKVLVETGWNLKQAADRLDIARGTLYSKMKKYGIEKPQ